jgi:hypothetical protein
MNTTENTNTIIYGAAAYGGKIHRTTKGGHAFCLNDRGHKPMRSVIASIDYTGYADFGAEAAALIALKVNPANLCRKCAARTAKTMKEAGA